MRRLWLLAGLLGFLGLLVVLKPLVSSGSPQPVSKAKGPVYDREGRLLFQVKEFYRVYYLGGRLVPEALRPYIGDRDLKAGVPYLVAKALEPEEIQKFSRISGIVLEKYFQEIYPGGPAFRGILEAFLKSPVYSERPLHLTLSWEVQESLYISLKKWVGRFERIGGVIVEIPSGEIFALVSLPESAPLLPLHFLFPVEPSRVVSRESRKESSMAFRMETASRFFGKATGLEIREALGIFWPEGRSLATPVQIARALASRLCGEDPELHLLKGEPFSGSCRNGDEKVKTEYNYFHENKWVYLTLWPKEAPRFVIVLAGELEGPQDFRVSLAPVFKELERYLPLPQGKSPSRGFPDLRGLTLRAALESLKDRDLRVRFRGFGKVVKQKPSPGTPWEKVKECVLYLQDET